MSRKNSEADRKEGDAAKPTIEFASNGPILVKGPARLEDEKGNAIPAEKMIALYRCGASKNKPFCDGSHWYIHFKGDNSVLVAKIADLDEGRPAAVKAEGIDLVLIRRTDDVYALGGVCKHTGAPMADGAIDGDDLVCALHGWAYDIATGANADGSGNDLKKFRVFIEREDIFIDGDEIAEWKKEKESGAAGGKGDEPSAGGDAPVSAGPVNREEPHNDFIRHLAKHGLEKYGSHGPMAAMGVPRYELPTWDDIQFVTAQLHRLPLLDDVPVGSDLVIGPRARKPLRLEIPLFVSDMSFGALSLEAKVALARGAELAGTAICSGEGGMLPEEQAECGRYLYELASARFGFSIDQLSKVQAFHFKGGQATKTGTGGHLPAEKVTGKIAAVRGLEPGNAAIQSIGCLGTRACHTNNCPVGIATQKKELRERLDIGEGAKSLARFFDASVKLMSIIARARGHARLSDLCVDDLTTWKRETAHLTGVDYGGVTPLRK